MLKIATGASRKAKKWKNIEISWDDLCKKLSETYRTRETMAEYAKLKKPEQDEIKDVGGFVGGWLAQGQRKSDTVLCRTVLTLDVDNALPSFWEDLTLLNDYACCIYSTHKHKPEAWRVRLIIPLAREVSAEEYEAIARWIAKELGIDQFDDTTYQASRLMYWPSTSKDGEFIFKQQDGTFLDPDAVLANYPDWHDVSFWPQSSRVTEIVHKQAKRQGDPLTKEGLIGAFCRTYSIDTAIETFLSDVYLPCSIPGRYTYSGGSTAAGLVLYDDKFAYSNHGTDPASGKLCNAFDLVRIHKFGELDDDAKVDTPANKLPSYVAMTDMAAADPETRKTLQEDRLAEAAIDFTDIAELDPEDKDWIKDLDVDRKGNILPTSDNFLRIMRNDKLLANLGGYNEFNHRPEVFGPLPWTKERDSKSWTDTDDAGLRHYIETVYKITGAGKCADALALVHEANKFHPVRSFLDPLEWDGIPRLDTLFIDYLGAEDCEYIRQVTRKAFTAAVARIYQPGCKFDYMATLTGIQGIGKSTLIKKMGDPWYSDTITTVSGKEAYEALQGVWLLEMSELTATRKADVEAVKQFISKQEDTYRMAYAKRTVSYPRQCIFIGTTNDNEFLRDRTGNRRFWVIEVGKYSRKKSVFDDLNQGEVAQIWAEAKFRYKQKENLYLSGDMEEEALKRQQEHTESNAKAGLIEEYLEKLLPENWSQMDLYQRRNFLKGDDFTSPGEGTVQRQRVCALEVWCELFDGDTKGLTNSQSREINDILRGITGWQPIGKLVKFGKLYGPQRGFTRVKNGG